MGHAESSVSVRVRTYIAAVALVTLWPAVGQAKGPDLPVRVVRAPSGTANAFLDFELAVDPAEVSAMSAKTSVESRGTRFSAGSVPLVPFNAPLAVGTFQAKVPGPRAVIAGLSDGVYVQIVEISLTMRGADSNAKRMTVTDTKYFRKSGATATEISSTDYTLAVQPLQTVPGDGGGTILAHAGTGGLLTAAQAAKATISVGVSADSLLPAPPPPAPRKR